MMRFLKWLFACIRSFLADVFGQIWALPVFIAAGLAWHYFSSIYAAIPVLVVGVVIGGYIWGLIEGKQVNDKRKDNKQGD